MPAWLSLSLAGVLLVLIGMAAVWLRPQPQAELKVTVPDVVFEDFHAAPSHPEPRPDRPELPPPPGRGVALVMDDVGYDLHALQRILALHVPVAISILPGSSHADEAAEMAHRAGQMVMLHLPMEPATEKYRRSMGPSFLRADMDAETQERTFLADMSRVPYVEGVNNHMGSHLTRLREPMARLMRLLRQQGLFFIDSRTSGDSIAALEAARAGIPWAERQIFLDHRQDEAFMQAAWDQAIRCQETGRACIVIAHPHPQTLAFLEHRLAHDAGETLQLKPVRGLLHAPLSEATRRMLARGEAR